MPEKLVEFPKSPEQNFLTELNNIHKYLESVVSNEPDINLNARKIIDDLKILSAAAPGILDRGYILFCARSGEGAFAEIRVDAIDSNGHEIILYRQKPSLYQPIKNFSEFLAQKTNAINNAGSERLKTNQLPKPKLAKPA